MTEMARRLAAMGQRKAAPKRWPVWAKAFLAELSKHGVVGEAAKVAKVHRTVPAALRNVDPAFDAAWEVALEAACDRLEREVTRRGLEGWLEPVFGSGGPGKGTIRVGTVRKFSDTLLIFKLKGERPEKYRERFENKLSGSVEVRSLADLVAKVGNGGS
jgi:hypothetical protein